MYLIGGSIVLMYFIIGILSRKEAVDKEISRLLVPFHKMAVWIYKKVCIYKIPVFTSGQVEKDLRCLHPGAGRENLKTDYYIKKISLSLAVFFVGTLFGMLVKYNSLSSLLLDEEGRILRGSYMEGSVEVWLKADSGEKKEELFRVEVAPMQLNSDQIKNLYDELSEKLPEYILGENESLEEITSDLVLEERYGDYPFLIEWESSNLSIIGNTGRVYVADDPVSVELTAKVTYEETVREVILPLQVVPKTLSPEEKEHAELEELLLISEYDSRKEETWKLPDNWHGEAVEWQQEVDDYSVIVWVLAIVTTVSVFAVSDQDLHRQVEQRKKLMQRDYPDIVHKLVLYVGAGMTTRGAFQKIAGDYRQKDKEDPRPAYEEMLYACRELHAGVSEGVVYEHFGKRTGLQEYVRLGTLLTQNLKKGNSTLLERLKEEADRAGEEKLQSCKRLGEEAGTKLLVPMVLMLVVVMVMIMIPAFSSM